MRLFGLYITTCRRQLSLIKTFHDRLRLLRNDRNDERKEHARKERQSVADVKELNRRCLNLTTKLIRLRGGKVAS